MQELKEILLKRKSYLEEIIVSKEKAVSERTCGGSIYAVSHRKGFQYYLGSEMGRSYIKAKDKSLVQKYVQNEYDTKVLAAAEKEHKKIGEIINIYGGKTAEDIYVNMPKGKRVLVNPIELSDEEYLEWWKGKTYQGLEFKENSAEFYSARGERMRSKSEVIIANLLDRMKLNYKYEKELKLDKFGIVHPDFTILDVKKRREVYFEHLGMLDDQAYRNNAISKIRAYEKNGYFVGDRLIVTTETINYPLDVKLVESKIKYVMSL